MAAGADKAARRTGEAPEPRWPHHLVVEGVQFDLIRTHGGLPGLRDEAALEAALARPRERFAAQAAASAGALAADLPALAAAYGHGIATGCPFVDGNNRAAFATMAVFLGLNGWKLEAPETDVVTLMLALAAGEIGEDGLAAWLRAHSFRAGSRARVARKAKRSGSP